MTNIKSLIIMYIITFAVLGCVTPEQVRQQMISKCTSYGFKLNTPEFSNCLMQLDQMKAASEQKEQSCLAASGFVMGETYFRCMGGMR
ncbi:hypothetical protein [Nitrosomonas ureae]|uniref:Lipoprotein n=1 Tax=Nitrosomonas ureae TaxID=44577 RepID=A0A1H5RW60_9PROT|nr:hypothetical protein [Nitrosomonas ureae]SEF42573.1 hypothetical protein SAMN05216334_101275 [Nitrosomonas ureae]